MQITAGLNTQLLVVEEVKFSGRCANQEEECCRRTSFGYVRCLAGLSLWLKVQTNDRKRFVTPKEGVEVLNHNAPRFLKK